MLPAAPASNRPRGMSCTLCCSNNYAAPDRFDKRAHIAVVLFDNNMNRSDQAFIHARHLFFS
jgi:hypothetical protein